jgi:hypothetical protein
VCAPTGAPGLAPGRITKADPTVRYATLVQSHVTRKPCAVIPVACGVKLLEFVAIPFQLVLPGFRKPRGFHVCRRDPRRSRPASEAAIRTARSPARYHRSRAAGIVRRRTIHGPLGSGSPAVLHPAADRPCWGGRGDPMAASAGGRQFPHPFNAEKWTALPIGHSGRVNARLARSPRQPIERDGAKGRRPSRVIRRLAPRSVVSAL